MEEAEPGGDALIVLSLHDGETGSLLARRPCSGLSEAEEVFLLFAANELIWDGEETAAFRH